MNDKERQQMRKMIGLSVLAAQRRFSLHGPEDVVPELLGALLSLAGFIARNNLHISREDFLEAAETAADERP